MAHIVQHLAVSERTQPDKIFCHNGDRTQTTKAFVRGVAAYTALLIEDCGLCCGDRVAVAAVNTDASFQIMLAVLAAGGLLTLVNWRWSLEVSWRTLHALWMQCTCIATCAPIRVTLQAALGATFVYAV